MKLKSKKKVAILKSGDIPIKQFKDPKKSGINTIMFKTLKRHMSCVSSSPLTTSHAKAIWAADWILKKNDSATQTGMAG